MRATVVKRWCWTSPTNAPGVISASDLEKHSEEVGTGLIAQPYTGFRKRWKDPSTRRRFTYLGGSGARWLVEKGAKAVGIDYPFVEGYHAKTPVAHVTLPSHGIPIIERLNEILSKLIGRRILFICLPIRIRRGDGAP